MDIPVITILVGMAVAAVAGDNLDRCPPILVRDTNLRSFADQCYQFIPYEKNWGAANQDCRGKGGHLVVIRNMATQLFLMRTFADLSWPYNGVWIGANDQRKEMQWEWVTGEKVGFSYWESGQPSCHILCFEDCAQLRLDRGGRWHDYKCDGAFFIKYSYVCQYNMLPTTTTTTNTTTTTTTTTTTSSTAESTKVEITSPSTTHTPNTTIIEVVVKPLEKHTELDSANQKHSSRGGKPTSTEKHQVYVQGDSEEHVQKVKPSHDQLSTGTLVLLVLGILSGILIGVCGGFLFCRRRRKAVKDDLPKVVFENPYYGEVTRPLTEGHEDSDDGEKPEVRICSEPVPKSDYDIPPSVSLSNPTYGAPVMLSGVEGAYDIVRTRKVSDYDCPPKPLPCLGAMKSLDANRVENIYESLENLQNLKAALAEKEKNERDSCCGDEKPPPEEERYVAMGTVPKHIRES